MKIPVTVRNVTVHLWSIWKVDIETCVCEKNGKLFTVDLKTLETIVNQHLPSAPHDWNKQKGSKSKIQQRGDMNNTKLNESLENIFTIRKNGLNTPATNFIPLGFKFRTVSVHEAQPRISLTFYCRTKMSRNTCIYIWSIAASVY